MPAKPKSASGEAAELIDLIIGRAPALHAAGVTTLSVGGLYVTLVPPPEKPVEVEAPPPPTQHIDPLQDPATFAGGRIPGFTRPGKP